MKDCLKEKWRYSRTVAVANGRNFSGFETPAE
jgi:hypothetical protein